MSVCVELLGRLGNNLWQIAACVGYAEKHKVEFFIPDWKYAACFKTNFTRASTGTTFYGEKTWAFEELPLIEDVKFFGYFQSHKYFEHCEDKIRELFQFNDQIKRIVNEKYKLSGTTCAMHCRRTDYIGSGLYEVCTLEYYKDAINEMKRLSEIDTFVVFSDDIEYCKSNFKGENFLFVEGNSDIEDLYLMTQCSNFIIANSSFSFWGAWLSPNHRKFVITPDRWYNDDSKDTSGIIPPGWIKIKIKA